MRHFRYLDSIYLVKLILILLLILMLAFYTVPWLFSQPSADLYNGIDFHAYWYAGQFVRQGINPYAAIINNPNPYYWDPRRPWSGSPSADGSDESDLHLPINFLVGEPIRSYPVARLLVTPPSVTAPLALLLELLSWFEWTNARAMWTTINLMAAIVIPWLGFQLLGDSKPLAFVDKLFFALAFYNFYGVRQGVFVGQQTLFCLFLLLASLVWRKHWLLSGILFGLALSKYSVALPVVAFFLLYRKYRIIIVGFAMQVVGVLLLMPLTRGSPFETIAGYLKVIDVHKGQGGIQVASTFSNQSVAFMIITIVVLISLWLVGNHFRIGNDVLVFDSSQLNKLNILTLASLVLVYHRIYDMSLTIFFFLVLFSTYNYEKDAPPGRNISIFVLVCVGAVFLVSPSLVGKIGDLMSITGYLVDVWLSPKSVSTFLLLFMFIFSFYKQVRFQSGTLLDG